MVTAGKAMQPHETCTVFPTSLQPGATATQVARLLSPQSDHGDAIQSTAPITGGSSPMRRLPFVHGRLCHRILDDNPPAPGGPPFPTSILEPQIRVCACGGVLFARCCQ